MMWSSVKVFVQGRFLLHCKELKRLASTDLKRTCLYDFHVAHGAKMVPFAGWEMPVQYKDSIIDSHLNVRANAGIFDVSHMLQTKVSGKDHVKFMESLVVADVAGLQENQGTLSVFTTDTGGIIDDLIINKTDQDYLYVVSNAGRADVDLPLMMKQAANFRAKGLDIMVEVICNGLLALQGLNEFRNKIQLNSVLRGPGMVATLQPGLEFSLDELPFMTTREGTVFGIPNCRVTRCGYTGEDGVEISVAPEKTASISVAPEKAASLADHLLKSNKECRLTGLGARDSLRLEAGLCLYGNDIDEATTPIEATLAWLIGKRRKAEGGFPGADIILQQIKDKPKKRRVGFTSSGPPIRGGVKILDESGAKQIGEVTSGCPSPSLKQNVAMGYVEAAFFKPGTKVKFAVRNKVIDGTVAKMPFVPSNYFFGKK